MVLQPGIGVEEIQTAADVMPWLERRRLGWFTGWIRTVGKAMFSPMRLMGAVPREAGVGEAWLFAFLTCLVILLFGVALPAAVFGALSFGGGAPPTIVLAQAGVSFALGLAAIIALLAIWGAITHGLLSISGPCEGGIGRTYQALLYSSAANLPAGVPCLGAYCLMWLTGIWWTISAILMVMEAQKVRGLRATICVGIVPAAAVTLIVGVIFVTIASASRTAAMMPTATSVNMPYPATNEAQAIGAAILTYSRTHNGQGPPHAVQLLVDGLLPAPYLTAWQVGHDENKVSIAGTGTNLGAFQLLPPNCMLIAAQNAAGALPADVIAHRLGDVVFTYHGIDLRNCDGQLWIAVFCADPAQPNAGPWKSVTSVAVLANGTTLQLPVPPGPAIRSQNALRASYGLPPLPDPSTVLNGQPARPNKPAQGDVSPAPQNSDEG